MTIKNFRAEVRVYDGRWTLLIPSLGRLGRDGSSLIEAEERMRRAIAQMFRVGEDEVCLELQDRRGIALERDRRTIAGEHTAIRT